MRRFFKSAFSRLRKTVTFSHMETLLLGTMAGAMLLSWCFQWSARLGASLASLSALSLAILVGLELGFKPLKSNNTPQQWMWTILGSQGLLAAWTLGLARAMEWQTQLLGVFPPTQLANPGVALAVLFGFALVLVAPPVFVLARIPFCLIAKSRYASHPLPPVTQVSLFVLGLALGVLISAFALSPILGLLKSSLLFTLLGLVTTAVVFFRQLTSEEPSSSEPADVPPTPHLATSLSLWESHGREIWAALMLLCLGGMFAWASRVVDQLMPVAVSLVCAKWGSLLAGWSAGFSWNTRKPQPVPGNDGGVLSSFFAGAWVVAISATFPWLVALCLSLTVSVSNVFLLTLGRLSLVFGVMAPLGIVWGRISAFAFQTELAKPRGEAEPAKPVGIPLVGAAGLAGWLLGQWVLLPYGSMVGIVIGFALAVLLLASARLFLETLRPQAWTTRAAMAAFSLLMLTSFVWASHYRPHASAQLLFAAPVFFAQQSGLDRDLLTAMDEGRLLSTSEGQQGTYTLWKYRGVQKQIRENGLHKGMASGNVRMCPDFSAEVLPAAMPLVLHERPDTILILGLGSGVPVTTALAFPTQEVTCVETDPALIELVKTQVWSNSASDPAGDPRLTILPIDPALWLRSKSDRFDVIVSLPHQATLAHSTAYFTEAFYRDASRKLTEEGLFCQRLAFIDFGPGALRVAARTMQAVFRDVVFLEMAGGEMLLMGTNAPQGVAREGFMDRLQRSHVRRQLAALGWDWSVPLNLSAYNQESLKKFLADSPEWGTGTNTSQSGTLAFRLPTEMMRWGPKPQENYQALAPHAGRFAEWGGIDPEDPDLLRRLAEVTGQRKLMVSHPDEYWVYRKAVKDQVTKQPRSVIVQVKGELPRREIHADEKRRLAYFRALGATFKHHPHRQEDIAKVEAFREPYDPLISFFLHQEVAELHARAENRNCPAELAHRVHSVFFAASEDRSVRNITAAIELLCEHPEACQTPLERFDFLNALLQMMKQRWAVRAGMTPTSTQVMLNDVDKSLAAVQSALQTLEDLHEEAEIETDVWRARRRFLETTVVHPLRAYRRQLLPFHQRERIIKEKKQAQEED